jgi:cytochrome c556
MKSKFFSAFLSVALVAVSGSALAQMKPEDQIKARQAGYRFMAWNMGKIKGAVEGPADQYNKDTVANAAKAVAAVANSGMGALFGPGTDKAIGDLKTRVKPEFFDPANREELGKIAKNFVMEANKLAEVSASGDQAAMKAQFGDMGKACKACHDKFREEDKK